MKVDIIIPSLNSPIIDQVIHHLENQTDYDHINNILIVGRDENKLIPKNKKVQLIDTKKPVLAAVARNWGATAASAELLVFLDSDCLPNPTWLSAHLDAHNVGHKVVSGSVLPCGSSYWHLVYNLTLFHEFLRFNPAGPRDFLATLNLSVRRQIFDQVGGMNENINRVEDVDWTTRMKRAGIQPYFWPEAAIYHAHSRTTSQSIWQDCALSGYHMRQLRIKHSDLLMAPRILHYPHLVWWLSPLIALWATTRILWKRPFILRCFMHTIPGIYWTKIAWCWGASRKRIDDI